MGRVLVSDIALLADAVAAHGVKDTYLLGSRIGLKHQAKAAGLPTNRIIEGDESEVLALLGAELFAPAVKKASTKKAKKEEPEPVLPAEDVDEGFSGE
jgi:hypothetical protein